MSDLSHNTTRSVADKIRGAFGILRGNPATIAVLLASLVFVVLLEDVAEGEILQLDLYAYRFLVQTLRSPSITPLMEGFTSLSSVPVILTMAAMLAALAPGKAPGWCVALNTGGAVALNLILKSIIQRPRPDGFRLISESGYSFPSGHSMVSMAFFGLIVWMIWRYHRRDLMRIVWVVLFSLLIVLVGISRVYLGVHYASDVAAGFAVSLVWLVFFTRLVAPSFMPDAGVARLRVSPDEPPTSKDNSPDLQNEKLAD